LGLIVTFGQLPRRDLQFSRFEFRARHCLLPNFYSEHIKSRILLKCVTPKDILPPRTFEHFCAILFEAESTLRANEQPKIRVSNFASDCYSESPEIAPASNQTSQNTGLQGRIGNPQHRRNLHGHIRSTQSI
jgi:hypothetical protein